MFTFADQEREYSRALQKERAEGRAEGIISTLISLVREHLLSVHDAARQADMSEEEFLKKAGLRM